MYCLLFINTFYLAGHKLDVSKNILLLNSENNDTSSNKELPSIQSAENCKGFSETVRQLSDIEDYKFWRFAGILDGDGNFYIRTDPTSFSCIYI